MKLLSPLYLVGPKEELKTLESLYEDKPNYLIKIENLRTEFSYFRRVIGDGNCFFRSFAFAYFEYLLHNYEEFTWFKNRVMNIKDELVSLGFDQLNYTDMHINFIEVINTIDESDYEKFFAIFNNKTYSNNVVAYLRLIASGQLQKDAEFFTSFLPKNQNLLDFCFEEVETMNKESDHIHIIALSKALKVDVQVIHLDGSESPIPTAHNFPNGLPTCVHLLYRPGHYDILYSNSDVNCESHKTVI